MWGVGSGDGEIECGEGGGDDKGSGFDAVRNDAMAGSVKFGHDLHADGGSSRTFDSRSHLVQQGGEVSDFGLAGAVLHDGLALGQRCSHEQIFGSRYRDLVEDNLRPFETLGVAFAVALILRNLRA